MRGIKLSTMQIESLVSGNVRIDGKIYTQKDARHVFKNNRQVYDALDRANHFHTLAKHDSQLSLSKGISGVNIMLNKLIKSV